MKRIPSYQYSGTVPCNGCIKCCLNDAIRILPHENPANWLTEPHPYLPGALMLAHKDNGECIYLDRGGCSIHDLKPQVCREMDCRAVAQKITLPQAQAINRKHKGFLAVWRIGKNLLDNRE